ncbi:Stf0 family sulfotransferase [Aestuariibius insulae]|uniref:Stf0 family sulfotransferase n=1 Tax=Aestuariibius insulae TaxID=2058287 RepID=UPI00345E9C26
MAIYEDQFSEDLDLPQISASPQIYMIASTPRCGSHFLGHILIETGEFGVPFEYLNPGNLKIWRKRLQTDNKIETLQALISRRTSANGWFGLKAHWSQFAPAQREGLLDPLPKIARIVFLYRSDLLSQAVSFAIAMQTGQWISKTQADREAHYNYDKILKAGQALRNQNRKWWNFLLANPTPAMVLRYEDVLSERSSNISDLVSFLDPAVSPSSISLESVSTKRQGTSMNTEWKTRIRAELRAGDDWILKSQYFDPAALLRQ